ncbi:hypothetical protein Rhe02_37580 [Rhizocola hellebori]|uniref:Uncharacterized protein n=1 Tax=Rhizocola hellebori TaxID=1392758 RepID=A0A8J3Q9Q1_9ACTN|nr:hypothetical protein [Rhizocola hellebori]GIH05691.1 hypothetical protein Rhe02_37580 [Rhizocola hellebori]
MHDLLTPQHQPNVPVIAPPGLPGLPPTGTAPANVPGRWRVFTGDWLANGCACHLYTDGYAGELIRRWNGWAVFRTSRTVAAAIVAHRQHTFIQLMAEHAGRGKRMPDAWLATLGEFASVTWLGSLIVVDRRRYSDDETDVEITTADAEGLYTIGWSWSWDDVDAAAVHTIHGTDSI